MKNKRILTILIIFSIYSIINIYAEPIISGFGIFYKTPYEEGLRQIKADGFKISEETIRKDTNTDRKVIKVDSFEYDGIPYLNGTFSFDRHSDGKYYFSLAEGTADLNKIEKDVDYAAKYKVFLKMCNEKYYSSTEQYDDVSLLGYRGDNGGYILLAFSDHLLVIYSPKETK